ncbi:uncharacterized protein MONBRDRAFT_13084, partial [Monosiga brevicollis MX1]
MGYFSSMAIVCGNDLLVENFTTRLHATYASIYATQATNVVLRNIVTSTNSGGGIMTAVSHVLMDQITCHRLEQPNRVYANAYFCIFVQEEAVNTTVRKSVLFGLSTVLLIQGTDTLLENLNINWALNSDGLPFALGFNTCNIMPGPSTNNTIMRNVKSLAQLGG